MSYVEWLRVRNCLVGVACTMAVIILLALVLRVVFNHEITSSDIFVNKISMEPGTKITHSVAPDGTPRTVIANTKDRTTVTIDGGGSIARHITIVEPTANGSSCHDISAVVQVSCIQKDGMQTTTVDTDGPVPIWLYFMVGGISALIVATCLGAPFARENDGHMEIAAMRPQARVILAVRTIGVDLAGIVLSSLVTALGLLICQALFEVPRFKFDDATIQVLAMSALLPFAWYALIAAATSSMKRAYGAVVGFAWPIAILVFVFGVIPWNDSVFGQMMHNVFGTLSWLDPLKYAVTHMRVDQNTGNMIPDPKIMFNITMEAVLFLVYSALAIFQWQKVEA